MATNGFANGHISPANGHLSSEDEEIDLRDNKYAVVATSPQKRNCVESDPERDSIEDPESGPEDDLPERHQKAAACRPYEEDMEVDEEDDLELEIACLKEDDTDSDRDEMDGTVEDEDFKDIGDEKGVGVVGESQQQPAGMTSAEQHELEVQHADPAICATVSCSGGGGGGGAVAGGGGADSGDTDGGAFPPHPNGSSVPAADVVVALEGSPDHPTGEDSSSSRAPRRSCQEEGQQQQQEQTPQTVITTPLGRSTSPDRVPSFHYTQEVEGPRPPLRYSPDPQHLTLQEEEEEQEEPCRSPVYTGPSTPPASPINAADAPTTSHPTGCLPLPSVDSPREPIDNKSAEESLTDPYNDDDGRELSGGFLEYLGTRMERSNSTEEKRDEEKLGEVPAAVDGASGELEVDVKIVDPEGKPRAEAADDEDDEKDVDTTAVSASGPEAKAEQGDDAGDGAETDKGDKSTQEEEKVGEGEATTESLEPTDDTAVDRRADVDAADKDVSDEKKGQKAEDEHSDQEEEEEEAKVPEPVSNILVTVDESPDPKDEDEEEEEGKITDAEPADAVPVVVDDSQPQEEVKEADLLQMSDNEQEEQKEAPPAAEASSAPEDEQTPEEPEVADRPESPVEQEAEPEATPAGDDVTAEPHETDDAAPEVPASPSPVPCEEVEPEITQPQTTATLEDNDDNAVEDEDTGADTQEEPAPAALEEREEVSTKEETPVGAAAAREDTEAADNASDEEQPTFIEHPSPTVEEAPQVQEEPLEEAAPETQSNLRSGATGTSPRTPPGDITRAEDKFDDGIESVQSISNIKNRFQTKDEKPPMPGDSVGRSRSSNGHVNGDRTPPEVVNRSASQEDILGRELPPVNMARSMASKFRDMESSDSSADRKPVRKITPPREDVERDVGRYHDDVERRGDVIRSDEPVEKGDERPPASFTRNMLAKFKEMEDTEMPPPSPARSGTSPTKRTHRPIVTHMKSSPDEGIADTEPVNGHRGAEVIRETDKSETEELPERGFTKSLVSQWRQIEQTAGGPTKSPLAPRQHGSTPSAVRNATTYRHASPANSESDDQREVVRESDNFEENLPPPSYTKNMLAKFQNMQEEAQRDPATTPTKKQFKWTVKETKPLWAPPTDKDELQPQSVNGHDETNGDEEEVFSSEDEEYYDEDDISLECDEHGNPIYPTHHPKHPNNVRRRKEEHRRKRTSRQVITSNGPTETEVDLPAPETTKKLLSQFKSMEDVSAPPPTPEMSVQRQRSTRSSISAVPMRYSTSSMESREQPDGIETTEINTNRECSPEERTNVVREADTDVAAELPEQGTTRNLLARFQSLQAV